MTVIYTDSIADYEAGRKYSVYWKTGETTILQHTRMTKDEAGKYIESASEYSFDPNESGEYVIVEEFLKRHVFEFTVHGFDEKHSETIFSDSTVNAWQSLISKHGNHLTSITLVEVDQ